MESQQWQFSPQPFSPAPSFAQDSTKPSSFSFRSKKTASRNKETYRWQDNAGNHSKTTERSRVVEVEVGGKPVSDAKFVTYWIEGLGGRF